MDENEVMEKITLYSGYRYSETFPQVHKIWYYTDDKDSLPADIRDFKETEYENLSITDFLREAFKGESKGFRYNIQIKELFYETPEP